VNYSTIADRLAAVREGIARACHAAGRPTESVRLVAVSKTQPIEAIREAIAAGQLAFGENRPQELVAKHAQLPEVEWHQIGQLQTNKVKYLAPFVHLIHVLDSLKLLDEIEKQAAKAGRMLDCLIQLNISDEPQKAGTDEAGAEAIVQHLETCAHVRIRGLMGIAEDTDDLARVGRQFARLRRFAEHLRTHRHDRLTLEELSMGMTHDYAVAIAEGATLVRVGSAIFGSRAGVAG
jgi:pyridoxal phosphate enzyme (YggS family)